MTEIDNPVIEKLISTIERDSGRVRRAAEQNIEPPPPLLTIDDQPFIHANSINAIQGKSAVHKSRLVMNICAPILALQELSGPPPNSLGFGVDPRALKAGGPIYILYVDTERNIRIRFPNAVQELHRIAGFKTLTTSKYFIPISLINIPRQFRQEVLMEHIHRLIKELKGARFLLIADVVTDCVSDINSYAAATTYLDWANLLCDKYNMTIINIIHENPTSEKARGHIGTEMLNKATSQIAIRLRINSVYGRCYDVSFLKTSESEVPRPISVYYDGKEKALVRCDESLMELEGDEGAGDSKLTHEIVKLLGTGGEISRADLCAALAERLNRSEDTVSRKIRALVTEGAQFYCPEMDETVVLTFAKAGKQVLYRLISADLDTENSHASIRSELAELNV